MHLRDIDKALAELEQQDRLRKPDDGWTTSQMSENRSTTLIDAASNDYLGLASGSHDTHDERSVHSDISSRRSQFAIGAGASRLIFGTSSVHREVEVTCAKWLGFEDALLFSSGFAANCGILPAIISETDAVFSDRFNHASLIDALRLSKVKPQIVPHLDLVELERQLAAHQEASARWVISESYYSMDGDGPDLVALDEICRRYDAHLFIDEAHALGVFGPRGSGLCAEAGIKADLLMAGFGKAVGSAGAIVGCSSSMRTFLWNRARSFMYSTAPSPRASFDLLQQIRRTQESEDLRGILAERCESVRSMLAEALRGSSSSVRVASGFGPILSLIVGREAEALQLASICREQGLLVQAIRPPTVPVGASRLRVTLKASWDRKTENRLVEIIQEAVAQLSSAR